MIRAFRDSQLTIPVGRDGSWRQALDLAIGERYRYDVPFYFYNAESQTLRFNLESHTFENFDVEIASTFDFGPGTTREVISFAPKADLPLPTTEDGTITLKIDFEFNGLIYNYLSHGSYASDSTHEWNAYLGVPRYSREDEIVLEVTLHQLPYGDERYGGRGKSYISDPEKYAEYIGRSMGMIYETTYNDKVRPLSALCYETVLWMVNKHYYLSEQHSPMFRVRNRSKAFGYAPPGVDYYPPAIKRSLLAKSFGIARRFGSQEVFEAVLAEFGMQSVTDYTLTRISATNSWRFEFTPANLAKFGQRFLRVMLQYHASAYDVVEVL